MILYFFPIAQNTDSENFYSGVYACIRCMCTYFTIFSIYLSDTYLSGKVSKTLASR